MCEVRREIKKQLILFELEPTKRRVNDVYHYYHFCAHYNHNFIEIKNIIQEVYRFRRVKNTRLAKKIIDESSVLRYTENWIYIKDY